MVARRDNVLRPFSFRIEGGDDQSSIPVDRGGRGRAAGRRVALDPPDSAGLHGQARPIFRAAHRAPVGTRVQITGKATKPLARRTSALRTAGRRRPDSATTASRSRSPASSTNPAPTGSQLTDREGLHGGGDDRWEIRAIPDALPTVQIEQPRANLFVTPQAVAPIRVSAKDDLALRDITLVFRPAESAPESSLRLFSGPQQPPPQSEPNPAGDSRVVDYRWNLAPLNLQPGRR